MAQQDAGDSIGVAATAAPSATCMFDEQPSSPGQQPAAAAAQNTSTAGQLQQRRPERQQHQQPQALEHGSTTAATVAAPSQPQQVQQQQQQQAWLAAWQQDQATGSSNSGSSLGVLLGQVSGGFPATDVPSMDMVAMDPMLATCSWQTEPRLTDSRGTSPLDVLGRPVGQVTQPQQPLSRQMSVPASVYGTSSEAGGGYRPSSTGAHYNMMSLPASPTMLQHQLQLGRASVSTSHSISPSTGSWPDMDMEQPLAQLAQQAAAAGAAAVPGETGENGDALLWPSGAMVTPPSSSPQLLHQPGVPLGLQLRLPAEQQQRQLAAAAGQRQQQLVDILLRQQQQQRQAGAAAMVPHQQRRHPASAAVQTPDQKLLQQHLGDQALMPPPLPVQPGSTAAARSTAPRPPPLIIPSSQPQQLHSQQHLGVGSAPTPSPAQPRSGTSITPAMLSMGLVDGIAAGITGGVGGVAAAAAVAESTATASGQAVAAAAEHLEDDSVASARPRRQRRRASVSCSPAVTASVAASGSPQVLTGTAALLAAGRQYVKVVCGSLQGWLDLTDMMVQVAAGQGHDECKLTPSGFENLAGKGATRKWRQSLTALPDGPTDPFIPDPMPVGDFMKQHMIDKGSLPTMHSLYRVSSSSVADDVLTVSPAAAAAAPVRHHALVSPGVRRRRSQQAGGPQQQLHGAFSAQLQAQDAEIDASDDQPQAHVKRSRGNIGSQQQHLSQQQQLWQGPLMDAWHAAAVAAAAAAPQDQLQQEQLASSAAQMATPHDDLHTMIAAVPAAAAASSLAAGGQHGLQLTQQRCQQQMGADVVMSQLPLPLPSLHWRSRSLLQQEHVSAGIEAASETAAAAVAAAPVSQVEHEQPAIIVTGLPESQQGVSQQQLTQGSQQGSQQSSSQQSSQQGTPHEAAGVVPGSEAPAKPLLSPAGRPIRQPSSRHRMAAAAASSRHDRSSQPVGFMGGVRHLQVWCDQLPGMLDLNKMQVFPSEGEFQGQAMSLSAFEQLGGRGTARKWRRSLTTLDGSEPITLGEWMERYQILAGIEGKHISPKPSPKPRATTPPSGGVVTAAQAAAAAAAGYGSWQGSRDQHVSRKQTTLHTEYAAMPIHPAALSSAAGTALQQQQQAQPHKPGRRKAQQAIPQPPAGRLPPMPAGAAGLGRPPGAGGFVRLRGSSPVNDLLAPQAAGPGELDTHHVSRDSSGGHMQTAAGYPGAVQQPCAASLSPAATAAGAAAGQPVNPELLMMLTEYASEHSHPELHLHPAQVEQDLADLTAGNGGGGLVSPRLGNMDWQPSPSKQTQLALDTSKQQQHDALSPAAAAAAVGGTSAAAAGSAAVPFSPASLLGGTELSGHDIMVAFSSQGELDPSVDDTLDPT